MSFQKIKKALIEAPALISPHFAKDFSIFSFPSQDTIVVVLLPKKSDGLEQPISFFRKTLRDSELKYSYNVKEILRIGQSYKIIQDLCFSFQNYSICS